MKYSCYLNVLMSYRLNFDSRRTMTIDEVQFNVAPIDSWSLCNCVTRLKEKVVL